MKAFEKILFALIALAIGLKFFGISGSGILFVTITSLLTLFYFIFSFPLLNDLKLKHLFIASSYLNISSLKTIGSIVFGIGLSLLIVGIMYTVQHWEGGVINLIVGIIINFFIGIVVLIKKKQGFNKVFYNRILLRIGVWMIIAIIAYKIS